ncbi:MAG TPA: hypothetical protein VHY91_20270 [Pirellulales bacterium]|nr:hypothetical protein [Pirellulales bacterium]
MSMIVEIPIDGPIMMPSRCVRCGNAGGLRWKCTAARIIDLLYIRWAKQWTLEVPVCGNCKFRRASLGILTGFLLLAAVIAFPILFEPAFARMGLGPVWATLWMVSIVAELLYSRNWHSGVCDWLLLGIQAVRFMPDERIAIFRLRDDQWAAEVYVNRSSIEPVLGREANGVIAGHSEGGDNPYWASAPPPVLQVPEQHAPDRPVSRWAALVALLIGALALVFNHLAFARSKQFYPLAVIVGPMILMLGVAGLVNPRVLRRMELPGCIIIVLGMATSLILFVVIYH